MDYLAQLEKEHSRSNTDKIAKAIGDNSLEFNKIIEIIYTAKPPLPQRASWLLAVINKSRPELLKPHLKKFIDTISDLKTDGIKRNMMLVLASHPIPKQLQGKLIDICYNFILSSTETVAVKVHSLQVIANISKNYPELQQELKSVIENQLPKNSAAFSARAKHILKQLKGYSK